MPYILTAHTALAQIEHEVAAL
uniref:Uncharacterized protein n=1 Tax=Arundo donax TaxID=35708 RepID=A0A0A9BN41_ARUDO